MIWATACGSISLRTAGAQDPMPTHQQLSSFLAERSMHVDAAPVEYGPGERWPEDRPQVRCC